MWEVGERVKKKSGRWENVVKKMWEVGDRGKKVGGGREGIKNVGGGKPHNIVKKSVHVYKFHLEMF